MSEPGLSPRTELFVNSLSRARGRRRPRRRRSPDVQALLVRRHGDHLRRGGARSGRAADTIAETRATLAARPRRSGCRPRSWRISPTSRGGLQPATAELRALPPINAALQAGVPASGDARAKPTSLRALRRGPGPVENPMTLLACKRPPHRARGRRPGDPVRGPVPDGLQLPRLLLQPARHAPSSEAVAGRHRRAHPRQAARHQAAATLGTTESTSRGHPDDEDPQAEATTAGAPHADGGPAVDSKGRADCQAGQTGYPFRLVTDGRYPPSNADGRTSSAAAATWWSTEHARPRRRHLQVAPARHPRT